MKHSEKLMTKKVIICSASALIIIMVLVYFFFLRQQKPEELPKLAGIAEATNVSDDILSNKYQNMKLPDSLNVETAEKAYIISADRGAEDAGAKERLEKFSLAYTGQKPDSVNEYVEDDPIFTYNGEAGSLYIGEIEDKYHIEYSSSNCIFAYRLAPWRIGEEDQPTAVFDLNKDDISSVSYKVAQQDYSLSDARICAESFIKDKLMQFMSGDTELRLDKAYVFKSGENYFYCFTGKHYIEGIPLSEAGMGSVNFPHMNGVDFRIYIDEPGIIGEVRNSRYPNITKKEEVTEIITLDEALAYLEEYLAPHSNYEISEVSLEYCSKDNGNNGNNFVYHPTWCFTVSTYQANVYQLEPRRVLYLDAVNNEVFCWDDAQGEFVFGDNIDSADSTKD